MAFGILRDTFYDGKSARFTFDSFQEKLQLAFSELSDCNVYLTETQKVNYLVENIRSDALRATFPVMLAESSGMSDDFGKCTAYLKSFLAQTQAQEGTKSRRNISGVQSSGRNYTQEEWQRMTQDERNAVLAQRKADKAKKKKAKGKGDKAAAATAGTAGAPTTLRGYKRKVAKLQKELAGKTETEDQSEGSKQS
jgi:hypothetical protein